MKCISSLLLVIMAVALTGCAQLAYVGMMERGMYSDHKGKSGKACDWYGGCPGGVYGSTHPQDVYGNTTNRDIYGDY